MVLNNLKLLALVVTAQGSARVGFGTEYLEFCCGSHPVRIYTRHLKILP